MSNLSSVQSSPWRSPGLWMIVILIGYILFNAVRSALNPGEFASYYGLPLVNPDNNAFVFVYAIRALFLGLFGLGLLIRKQYSALTLYALIGSVMPLGDALLVGIEGGGTGTILRHLLTAVFLFVTWFFMRRWNLSRVATA